jgi:peptidoglycan hydrolase-like protein with peptidoglycan-binding domain
LYSIGKGDQKNAKFLFSIHMSTPLSGIALVCLLLAPARRIVRAKPVRNPLFLLLLISGCTPLHQQKIEVSKPADPPGVPLASKPAETPAHKTAPVATLANPTLGPEEIRLFQARLKAAGFYPAPVDGIAGPKTRSGALRLQAACANLKDLLETSTGEVFEAPGGAQAPKPNSEEIRLIQVRLKDAGFEPGPIDGRPGAKTRAAFLRFQAGCTTLKNLPATWNQEPGASQLPTHRSAGKSHPATAQSIGIEIASSAAAGNQSPGNEKIRQEQLRLRDAGFDPGPIDGILGPKTKAAMQRYQKSLRLMNPR